MNVNEKDKYCKTPIEYALILGIFLLGFTGVCRYLLTRGAVLDKDIHKEYLFKSAEQGKLEVLKFLIENGFDINCKDEQGETPIFKAISSKCFGVTKFLFEHNASLGIINKYGESLEMLINKCEHQLIRNYFFNRLGVGGPNQSVSQSIELKTDEYSSKSVDQKGNKKEAKITK